MSSKIKYSSANYGSYTSNTIKPPIGYYTVIPIEMGCCLYVRTNTKIETLLVSGDDWGQYNTDQTANVNAFTFGYNEYKSKTDLII
jgi:hypothetical protein